MGIKKMRQADWTEELSDVLFWDVDRKTVNPERHLRWILERVLERGEYGDWLVLKKMFPSSGWGENYTGSGLVRRRIIL